MDEDVILKLTARDNGYACAFADKIVQESRLSDEWYGHFEAFAALLDSPNSLVRNRALNILAANARWDGENRFDAILPRFLSHITDEKPITARQCVKALAWVGKSKPELVPEILKALSEADLTKYKDSMRPLIEADIRRLVNDLTAESDG